MAQTSLEVSSSFVHNVFAPSVPPAYFGIRPSRHPVYCESTAGLDVPLPSSFSLLAYQQRSEVKTACDRPFSERVADRLGVFLVRTEGER